MEVLMALTKLTSVASSVAWKLEEERINDLSQAYEFNTLDEAINADFLVEGKVLHLKERTTGNGGGAIWDVVLASSVTPNTFNIVQRIGVPALAIVLRADNNNYNVAAMGAIADGVTDNSPVFNAARDIGENIFVPKPRSGLSYKLDNLNLLAKQVLCSNGAELSNFSAISHIVRHNNLTLITGFTFSGSGKLSGNTAEHGIFTFDTYQAKTLNCHFKNFGGSALLTREVVNEHEGNLASNITIESCHIGVNADERGEYWNVNNVTVKTCTTGVRIQGGNFNGTGLIVSDNVTGIHVVSGSNDAHGQITGCLVNHNTGNAIIVDNPTFGFGFYDMQMYQNGPIHLLNCDHIRFVGGGIGTTAILEEGCTQCSFSDFDFIGAARFNNTPNYNGSVSEVFYHGNRQELGSPTGFNSIEGGWLLVTQTANSAAMGAGANNFTFDTINFNAITSNGSYTQQAFYSTGLFNGASTQITRGFELFFAMQLAISRSDLAPLVAGQVIVSIVTAGGVTKGYFTPVDTAPAGATIVRYSLNGAIARDNCKIVIENNTGVNIFVKANGPDSGLIRSTGVVTGW